MKRADKHAYDPFQRIWPWLSVVLFAIELVGRRFHHNQQRQLRAAECLGWRPWRAACGSQPRSSPGCVRPGRVRAVTCVNPASGAGATTSGHGQVPVWMVGSTRRTEMCLGEAPHQDSEQREQRNDGHFASGPEPRVRKTAINCRCDSAGDNRRATLTGGRRPVAAVTPGNSGRSPGRVDRLASSTTRTSGRCRAGGLLGHTEAAQRPPAGCLHAFEQDNVIRRSHDDRQDHLLHDEQHELLVLVGRVLGSRGTTLRLVAAASVLLIVVLVGLRLLGNTIDLGPLHIARN